MTKSERREAIRDRAARAIRNLYHNATPSYPIVDDSNFDTFEDWLSCAASDEIEYIQSGGAYGHDYRATLSAPCNAGRFKSEVARRYYITKGMRSMRAEQSRCNALDSHEHLTNALWERVGEYGRLYQYGRGGRTLAPDALVKHRGGSSFSLKEDYAADSPIANCVEFIRILESFNRHVADWCKSIPEQWADWFLDNLGGGDLDATAELSTTD